jgi:hypothetical protein
MTDRKNPGVTFWATVVVILVVTYSLSFGPACWINDRTEIGSDVISIAYRPVLSLANDSLNVSFVGRVVRWYASVGATRRALVIENHVVWDNFWASVI